MLYIKGLFALLQSLPQLLSLLEAVGQAVETGAHYVDVHIKLGEFDDAAKKAKDEKDTSGLEDIFNPKPGAGSSGNASNPKP